MKKMIDNLKINGEKGGKKAQITIFIIVAILIVAAILAVFLLKNRIRTGGMPREILPVYEYFLSCIEDETKIAASIMGSQAGYLELPEFERGSEYMPFSSQLDFLGTGVPYWYYVSGNNIAKEQVPSKEKMQEQLKTYLEEGIMRCDYSQFRQQGFNISIEKVPEVKVKVEEREIQVEVDMPLSISFGETTGRQTNHKVEINSRLGKFYNIAKKIYDKEQKDLFLENYAVDVLRLYAPVDGSELTCSPKVWLQDDVKDNLREALQANTQAIKIKGNYYTIAKENKYFVQDIGESIGGDSSINFLYFEEWPTKINIYPDDDPLIAEPVGLQEGLGVLGFCYVPYHFVYDIAYPVLIQIYDTEEMFQFPIAVIIDKNKAREAENVEGLPDVVPELCEHKLTEIKVYTYNSKLEPVEADISFKCFDTKCSIGKTKITESSVDAVLTAKFPQCVNGFVIAKAEGYETKKYVVSSVKSTTANIVLDKEYILDLDIEIDNKKLEGERAIIYFQGENSFSVAYPEQQEVKLSEGQYEIKVYVYENSTISFQGSTTRKCVDVPKSGISGIFGATKEKCFDITVPTQTISFAIAAGGKTKYYFGELELEKANKLKIKAASLPKPTSLEQLQDNYALLEEKKLLLEFE